MDTAHCPLFDIAAKDDGGVVPEDAQITAPLLIPCGLKCFCHTNSSIVSLFLSYIFQVLLKYQFDTLPCLELQSINIISFCDFQLSLWMQK